jgi:hypothetical protein
MALEMFTKKFMDFASRTYKKSVATELNKMGKSKRKRLRKLRFHVVTK